MSGGGEAAKERVEALRREEEKLRVEVEAAKGLLVEQTDAQTTEKLKKAHIDALHEYNEVKDAAQVVLGVLANHQQETVKHMHQKYQLPTKDY